MTRQQIEHVRDLLRSLTEGLGGCAEQAPEEDARLVALLDIQQLQMETARQGTEEWIAQIDECIRGISIIGQSEVAALETRILDQGEGLRKQLDRIEELKQESVTDDADLLECIAGLRGVMEIAQGHLVRLKDARERMRLLNFNSMIEARRLGKQAAAVLEIARSISRISTEWSELTDRSGEAIEQMMNASSQSETEHRMATGASREALESVQRDGNAGVETLQAAAALASSGAAQAESAMARMQQRIEGLSRIAGRLRGATASVEEARRAVVAVREQVGRGGAGVEFDRQRLEEECASSYTCEMERQVLRSVLYGEALMDVHALAAGNDVELF
jgi:myosin heavy subunit